MNSHRIITLFLLVGLVTAVILLLPYSIQKGDATSLSALTAFDEPYLVKNINPRTEGSYPQCVAVGNAFAVCTANDGLPGTRIWRSDGTKVGTFLLKEIFDDGGEVYLIDTAVTESGKLYFTAVNSCCGYENQLWITDGTSAGTVMVKELPSGSFYGPISMVTIGEMLYFVLPKDYPEIWKSDGTDTGTELFFKSSSEWYSVILTAFKSKLYFRYATQDKGMELWTSDGSTANTKLFIDINPGEKDSNPDQLTVAGDTLFFISDDGTHGQELWKTNGLVEGTELVKDLNPGEGNSYFDNLTPVGNLLFFNSLWRTDGTESGTINLASSIPINYLYEPIIAAEDLAYFKFSSCEDGCHDYLGRSDGTPEGTIKLMIIDNDEMIGPIIRCNFGFDLKAADRSIYFPWGTEETGCELWRSDGSVEGTQLVQDIMPGSYGSHAAPLTFVNNKMLLHMAQYPSDENSIEYIDGELAVTDGTAGGAKLLMNINLTPISSNPSSFGYFKGRLFFSADDGFIGEELWSSDGSEPGTRLVKDIRTGKWGSLPSFPAAIKNGLVFSASTEEARRALFTSDGTAVGTTVIKAFTDKSDQAYVGEMTEWNGYAFFKVTIYPEMIYEFWRTDGTTEGTIRLGNYYVEHMIAADNQLYFIKRDVSGDNYPGSPPTYLGVSDGTPDGTTMLGSLPVHECELDWRSPMAVIGDQLFFPWCDGNDDLELWTLSSPYGQAARVKDINSQGSSNPESLAIFDNTVYFTADDGEHGPALWRSDGTESGTEMVTEIPAYELTPYSDGFFFLSDGLWVSDGTAGATEKLSDISYFFSDLTVAADHLFYIDEDFYDDKDNALMASDGTAVGTGMVGTTCAAAFGNLTPGGDKLYFSGMDKLGDLELWALNLGNLAPVADFSAAPTRGPAGHTVHFKNGSSGGFDSCTWTFGDGQTASTCGDQAHTYSGTGVYTVSLAISGPGGDDSLTRDQFIHITDDEAVTADFSLTPTFGPTPLTVNFTNLSTGDFETCFWDFGNDETVTGCADQTYTYTQPGIYSVSLSVLGPGGINAKTISEMITVNYPVTTDFIASPTSGIAPLTVSFDNHSTGDFDTCSWDFGDGQTGTNCTGQTHTYDAGGVYTVSLTASGPGGSNTKTISDAITVYGVVTAEFSASPTIGPPPLKVDFKNLSSGTYNTCAWIFGDGISSPSCEDTSHIYNKPGAFDVSLTVAGPGGEDTTAKKVNVLAEMFQSYMPSIVRE